jgi:hypothetical protein
MDSPIVAHLFRQLFRHRPRGCQGLRNGLASRPHRQPVRGLVNKASIDRGMKTNESRWQQRTHILPEDRREEFAEYPYISLPELKMRSERPRKVKMLLRDFIDGMWFGGYRRRVIGLTVESHR